MSFPSKQKSPEEALAALMALCARAEHSQGEMLQKMRQWQISEQDQAAIMQRLIDQHFVDDQRFARAFVKDKRLYAKWGPRKIDQALRTKGIDQDTRRDALDEISGEQWLETLQPLLDAKRRQTHADNQWELNGKLVRYALSRGFTYPIIRQCIADADQYEADEDLD